MRCLDNSKSTVFHRIEVNSDGRLKPRSDGSFTPFMPEDSYNPASIPDRKHPHKNGHVDCGENCTFKQWLKAVPKKDWYYFGTTITIFTIISIIAFTDSDSLSEQGISEFSSLVYDYIREMLGI
jgi:hypothetical protein